MKYIFLCLSLLLGMLPAFSQNLYLKTFGKPGGNPVIFLHGGPGYNSANFEGTTAQKLADEGFYVIVYDRRGEGRSVDKAAAFTFSQTFADLDSIYAQLKLRKATLIGHSFGGVVATLYADKYPQKINAVILVSAPVSLQETFRTIIRTSRELYLKKGDSSNLRYITMLEGMDTASIAYSSYAFGHAMQNGFYVPKHLSEEAKNAYALLLADSLLRKEASSMTFEGPQGFMQHEQYTSINVTPKLQRLAAAKVKVYGLYGQEDGLYSQQQIAHLRQLIGADHLLYLEDCSHNVFIDQQAMFIAALKRWVQ